MSTIHYILHDLIEVVVDERVSAGIINAVEFQLDYFKKTNEHLNSLCRVIIVPYDDFVPNDKQNFCCLDFLSGISGRCLDDAGNRAAVEKKNGNFYIYTDQKYLPINLFIQLILIEHDISLLSAAAVADSGEQVTLFPGAGGAGKSALTIRMVKDFNYRLLGDDTVCLNKQGLCLSFPRKFHIKDYDRPHYDNLLQSIAHKKKRKKDSSAQTAALRLAKCIRDNSPFLGLLNFLFNHASRKDLQKKYIPVFKYNDLNNRMEVPISEIVGPENISREGNLERVVYLQRYKGSDFLISKIDKESLIRRTLATSQNEWALQMRLFCQMGSLEILDLPGYFERVAEILRNGFKKKDANLLLIPEKASPQELVDFYFRWLT